MSFIVEAIYESGVLKLLMPLPQLKEQERVRLTVELVSTEEDITQLLEQQRQRRIQIEPQAAREIGDSQDDELLKEYRLC